MLIKTLIIQTKIRFESFEIYTCTCTVIFKVLLKIQTVVITCILILFLESENVELMSWTKDDWYVARKHDRNYILEVIYVIRHLLEEKVPIKREHVQERILSIQQINLVFVTRVASEDWQKLRTIVRNMHVGQKEFIEAGRVHWQTTLMQYMSLSLFNLL